MLRNSTENGHLPEFESSEIQTPIHDDASMLEDAAYEFGQVEFTSTPGSSEVYAAEDGAISQQWAPSPEFENRETQILGEW